jgi:hypothetical protein
MPSSEILRHVALVRTDASEEPSASIIMVTRIGELGRTLAVTSLLRLLVTANVVPSSLFLVTLMMEALDSSETPVLTNATRRNILEDGFFVVVIFALYRISHYSVSNVKRPSGIPVSVTHEPLRLAMCVV